tara:strand:- start:4616 stop:5140 length:525 start_codon:yes stop_codon:yes gene_type:complete
MSIHYTHEKRYTKTISFVNKHIKKGSNILDLGIKNILSERLISSGYVVENTKGENLDIDFNAYSKKKYDCLTAFEIFEHMLAPFNILKSISSKSLIASVPLKLWFSSAYWNENDDWDKHYHEFEPKQFKFLLEKSGWIIKDFELWTSPDNSKIGIRPLLRNFYKRYYIVYCERN